MAHSYPPTLIYSWDYTDTVFELEQRRAKRVTEGWKPEGDPRPVYVMEGSRTVLKHMQTYIRAQHQAVPKARLAHATAESHATLLAHSRPPHGDGLSRGPFGNSHS